MINGVWDSPWWGLGISGSFRYASGSPFTATVGRDLNNDANSGTDRPTVGGRHFERNSFRQPEFYTLDLRLSKDFTIGPGDLGIFAECFNCSDAANRSVSAANQVWGPNETANATFGVEDSVGTPRTIQLGLRYDF